MANLALIPTDLSTPNINDYRSFKLSALSPYNINSNFRRESQATLSINDQYRIIFPNKIRWNKELLAYIIEPESTNYLRQDITIYGQHTTAGPLPVSLQSLYVVSDADFVTSNGDYVVIYTGSIEPQTIDIPVGSYTLWISGAASITAEPITAVGTGFGTATDGNPIHITITSPGTVSLSILNTQPGDIAQFESCRTDTTWIPNDDSLTSTTRTADQFSININGLAAIYGG